MGKPRCLRCKNAFKQSHGNQKYCPACQEAKAKEKWRTHLEENYTAKKARPEVWQ